MTNAHFTTVLPDELSTIQAGKQLACLLQGGITVYLHGDLGAGKTTFVRGVLQGLGHVGKVKSPTYTIVEPYVLTNIHLYHFDLYRFTDEEEWEAAGFRDYFNPQSVCMIEWPEKAAQSLPVADIDIVLRPLDEGRLVEYFANTAQGKQCLISLE